MLSRSFSRARSINSQHIRFFSTSPAGFNEYQNRMGELQKLYPGLYKDGPSFQQEQTQLLDTVFANLPKDVEEYNKARQKVYDLSGEDVFMTLSADELKQSFVPVGVTERSTQEVQRQLQEGGQFISELIKKQNMAGMNELQQTLQLIEVHDLLDKLDYWKLRLQDNIDEPKNLGLPISDSEMDDLVKEAYYRAPAEVKTPQPNVSDAEHEKIEDAWMANLDAHLADVIASRVKGFDKQKFMDYSATLNNLFHPRDIDHYPLHNESKALMRAVFWQGNDRFQAVAESMTRLSALLDDKSEASARFLRGAYETAADTKNKGVAAMQLRLSDPLFSARLVQDVRTRLDGAAFDLSVADAMKNLEMPLLEAEKKDLETELLEGESQQIRRKIAAVAEKQAAFNTPLLTVDAVLDEVLPPVAMGGDVGPLKQAFTNYATGKASLSDINKAFDTVIKPTANAEAMTTGEITKLAVDCHNAKTSDKMSWNFAEVLAASTSASTVEDKLMYRRLVKKMGESLGLDPLVVDLLRELIDRKLIPELRLICNDFGVLVKKHLGEIDATISVAEGVSDDDYNQIVQALQAANPDKKFTIDKVVEPGLLAGFIVKAGVQTFDYSLTTQILNARRQMNV